MVHVGADTKDAVSGINSINSAVMGMGKIAVAAAAATVGAFAAFTGMALKTGADFEEQVSKLGAISGESAENIQLLKQSALDLGQATSKSASEVAAAQTEMAKSGLNANQILAATPGIISASEASGESMGRTTEVVTSAITNFGLEMSEASRVADILAMAANRSRADINDLGYAFKYAGPIANAVGIEIEELAAAVMIMSDAGLEGENSGRALRMSLIRLADPPKEAAEMIDALGLRVKDAAGNMLPFDQIVGQLAESTAKMGNAQKLATFSTLFGAEAAAAMLTVIEAGPEKLRAYTKELQNSAGASKTAADIMKNNLKGDIEQMSGAWQTLQITFAEGITPFARSITQGMTRALQGITAALPAIIQSVQDSISTIQQAWAGTWTDSETIQPIHRFVGTATQVIKGMADKIGGSIDAVRQVFGGTWFPQEGMNIDPFVLQVGEIAGKVKRAFEAAKIEVENARNNFREVLEVISDVQAGKGVRGGLGDPAEAIGKVAQAVKEFSDGFSGMATKLGTMDTLAASMGRFADAAERFGNTKDKIAGVFGALSAGFSGNSGGR